VLVDSVIDSLCKRDRLLLRATIEQVLVYPTSSTSTTSTTTTLQMKQQNTLSRKRLRVTVWSIIALALPSVSCFLAPLHTTRTTYQRSIQAIQSTQQSALFAIQSTSLSASQSTNKKNDSNRLSKPQKSASTAILPRLSLDEQMDLLRLAVEARRLKQLALETPSLSTNLPNKMRLAREAGYGQDWEAYENALDEGAKARETLVTRNMGLVHFCVTELTGMRVNNSGASSKRRLQSLSREDLVQEGAIGLARAVDRWDPAIGGKFSTYAVYWIRAAILRCIAEKDDPVCRVPEHVSAAVRKMTKAASQLGIELDGEALLNAMYDPEVYWKEAREAKALAEQAGLSNRQLAEAIKVKNRRAQGVMSFETLLQNGGEKYVPTSADGEDADEDGLSNSEREQLTRVLSDFLKPREMEALSWRYGLRTDEKKAARNYIAEAEEALFGSAEKVVVVKKSKVDAASSASLLSSGGRWGEAMSFVEVGERMKCSAEYGRRLCHAALEKLRRAADEGKLEAALLF
jgi:RNA polymerase sigma factor (sigma-70 family)